MYLVFGIDIKLVWVRVRVRVMISIKIKTLETGLSRKSLRYYLR